MSAMLAIGYAALAVAPLLGIAGRRGARGRGPLLVRAVAMSSVLGCLLLLIAGIAAVTGGARPRVELGGWLGFGHSALRVDGVAGIFLALTGLTGAATALAYAELEWSAWLTSLGALALLCVALFIGADNAFLMLLAWEALNVCIYLLTGSGKADPAELLGGYFASGLTKLGGAALLAAIGLLYAHTHSFALAVWAHAQLGGGTRGVAFLLFLLAFGSKVGLLPLQGALPAGYAAATRVGAAALSVALSAGFYGLWRFEVLTLSPLPGWCGETLLVLGALSAITGIVYATMQDGLREFLGYSTVEHAGIVLLGLGVALLGLSAHDRMLAAAGLLAATLHVCAHNLAKTLALIGVARLELATGERTLAPLGGLGRVLPLTCAGVGIASLTLGAIPPLGGFVSEWFTFEALLQGFLMPTLLAQLLCALAAAALAFTAGIGLLAFAKYFGFSFLGPPRAHAAVASARARAAHARWPPSLLALGVVVALLGAAAPWEIRGVAHGLQQALGFNAAGSTISSPLVLGPVFPGFAVLAPTWLLLVLAAFALLAATAGRWVGGHRGVRRAPVWVTGSDAEPARVQYRPSAYSNPLRVVLRGPLGFRTRLLARDDGSATLETSVVNAAERFLYRPLTRALLRASGAVRRLQSGRLSAYLLYLLLALLAALALIPILH